MADKNQMDTKRGVDDGSRPAEPISDASSYGRAQAEVEDFIEKTDIGEPPAEPSVEEQLKASNATLREELRQRTSGVRRLKDELASETDFSSSIQRSLNDLQEKSYQENADYRAALELLALYFAGDEAPTKVVMQLELLAVTEKMGPMERLRPIIRAALSEAYARAIDISVKGAEALQQKAEEVSRQEAEEKLGSIFGKIFTGEGGRDRSPLGDLFGEDIPGDPGDERNPGCGDPDCANCGPGGLFDRMGL